MSPRRSPDSPREGGKEGLERCSGNNKTFVLCTPPIAWKAGRRSGHRRQVAAAEDGKLCLGLADGEGGVG